MRLVRLLEASDLVCGQVELDRGCGVVEVLELRGADDRRSHDRLGVVPRERDLRA